MPDSATAGPTSHQPSTITTTTTGPTITTTTTYGSRGRPYTVTSSQPAIQAPTPTTSSPVTVVSTPSPAAGSSTTRTAIVAPTQTTRMRPIGIRRLPSSNLRVGYEAGSSATDITGGVSRASSGRGRSTSAPQHASNLAVPGQNNNLTRQNTRQSQLASVAENPAQAPADSTVDREAMNEAGAGGVGRRRSVSNAARSVLSKFSEHSRDPQEAEYESEVVDLLDVLGMIQHLAYEYIPRALTRSRSRSLDIDHSDQCAKLTFRAGSWPLVEQKANVRVESSIHREPTSR